MPTCGLAPSALIESARAHSLIQMGIAAGTRLGPYEIQSALGAGGMGEVYKARDTRLDRTVAVKVLPSSLASDPQLRERFEREARAVAALNHPHICTLYDVGRHEETDYLVMEHLEGETLAERLTRGALPIDEALRYAIEIAGALDKAHGAGIVHRDLKPANIFLAGGRRGGPSGPPVAKLLDFGLAKTTAPTAAGAGLSMLPTTPPGLTVQGTILGTFQYMAPEQLEGQEADARTDIFAFGAVLYEMLTGRKAFEGKTQASLIAAILEREPPPVAVAQPLAPPMLDRILKRSLAKSPDDRWQTARDLGAELEWARTSEAVPVRSRGGRRRLRTVAGIAVVLAAALIATGVVAVREFRESVFVPSVIRFQVSVSPIQAGALSIAVSPDGKSLAFVSQGTVGFTTLWIHSLESFATIEMTQVRQPSYIAWAPDSRRVAFVRVGDRKVQMLDVPAGAVQDVFDAPGIPRGVVWSELGIVVASDLPQGGGGLFSVSSPGAQPRQILERAGARLSQPILVDRGALAFLLTDEKQNSQVCVMEATGTERGCAALAAMSIGYSATGHLLFSRGRTLFAQRFDSQNVALRGDPFAVTNDVSGIARQYWAVSSAGSAPLLAYFPSGGGGDSQFAWFDRSGSRLSLIGEPAVYGASFDLSANDAYIVAARTEAAGNAAFLIDVVRGAATRIPGPGQVGDLVWAPDGRRFAWQSGSQVTEQPAFGGTGRVVFQDSRLQGIEDWSPDGRYVLVGFAEPDGKSALAVPVAGGMPISLATSTGLLDEMRFSPDGRWIAYNSDESGRHEVYVAPLPATGERWPVSTAGGVQARWRGDGRELYFLALDGTLMAVDFTAGGPPNIGEARRLFETGLQPTYNLDYIEPSADGKRFLIRMPLQQGAQSALNVVLNWTTLLPN